MPKNINLNRRSVGTQSNNQITQNEYSENSEGTSRRLLGISTRFSGLCKKSAYRNLLQRSIILEPQERVNRLLECIKSERSIGTQTRLENKSLIDNSVSGLNIPKERSVEVVVSLPEINLTPSLVSEEISPILEDRKGSRIHYEDVPGTSGVMTHKSHLNSVSLQLEEYLASIEGSLALACNSEESTSFTSRLSNIVYLHENQGLRRQSNEAVLLVEDYQSYDFLNLTRRQDTSKIPFKNRLDKMFYKKKKCVDEIRRPIPIIMETSTLNSYVCRICHEGEDIESLIRPCLCKGSIGSIHPKCLKLWLEQSNTSRCEICGYPYVIRQTKRYSKLMSISVFLRSIVDRKAVLYDVISFLAITPLCIVGMAMCLRASFISTTSSAGPNFQIGNVTKAGMIMLSTTIFIAYGIWLYTLLSMHYKSWKRWYKTCYDVEVIPVNMTSQERMEALQRLAEEKRRRSCRMERGRSLGTVLHSSHSHPYVTLIPNRIPVTERVNNITH